MNKAIFLDRDGVINKIVRRPLGASAPWKLDEFELCEDIGPFVDNARRLNYIIVVVTNQPDVARGHTTLEVVEEIHKIIRRKLNIQNIEASLTNDDSNYRRKPNPGMLTDAAKKHNIDLSSSFIIGDSLKDIQAGKNCGVKTILLRRDYNQNAYGLADFECANLYEALESIKSA